MDKKKRIIDWIIKIALIVIIILLLIHNCELTKKNNNIPSGGNVDIIEIICNNNVCNKKIESLSFAQNKVSIKKGETINLIVIIKPSDLASSKLNWESSDTSIVTVDANGVIKGIKNGTATITVTSENGKKATCIVEVVSETINVKKINLIPEKDVMDAGTLMQISATVEPANATNRDLVWSSSDPSIATVDNKGVVRGIKNGTVTITAKTKDGKVVATTTITVRVGEFEVYDNDHTPITWNGASDLKIFSKTLYTMDGKIAPESSNTYQFVVKNSTVYNVKYKINFIETNEYNINMRRDL